MVLFLDEVPPVTLVTIRLAIATLIFLPLMKYKNQHLPAFGMIWLPIIASSIFGNALPFFLISWGQEKVDAGLAAIFMACMPLMTIVIAHAFTSDEKLNIYKIIGFCFGLLGVIFIIGFDKLGTLGEETIRQYAIIFAAICYAINVIISKSLINLPRMAMMMALMLVSTLTILPVGLITGETAQVIAHSWPSFNVAVSVLLLGIFPTSFGTILIFKLIARQGASFMSQINFMVPVFGVLWSMVFLSEVLPPNAIIALILILAGVAIARIKPKSKAIYAKEKNL